MSIIDDNKLQNGIQNQNLRQEQKGRKIKKFKKKSIPFFQKYRNSNNI